jgi:6-phosphofructokinase 1
MRVGILTGGGDCPGLNPAIRGAVMRGIDFGFEMVGLEEGWRGLLEMKTIPLSIESVEGILYQGGTILGSSRTNPFKKKKDGTDDSDKAIENFSKLGLDALIAIGGDDTLGVASKLYEKGFKTVGVPKTMDNDLSCTDYTFGFDTAVSVAVDSVDRLRDTARSHRRILVVEAMGRNAGWVALYSGMAGAADWILIPEVPTDYKGMTDHLKSLFEPGRKRFGIVVASEGVNFLEAPAEDRAKLSPASQAIFAEVEEDAKKGGKVDNFGHPVLAEQKVGPRVAQIIENETGVETRSVVLGHIVRGGSPTVFDRMLGTRVGVKAAEMVKAEEWGKMAALQGLEVVAVPLKDAVGVNKTVPPEWFDTAKIFFK